MPNKNEISRETWSTDSQYFLRAFAIIAKSVGPAGIPVAKAIVQVFRGHPAVTSASEIFISMSTLGSYDLLDELQNAERIGRDFIASIQRFDAFR
jgi:hypothetical protein